MSPCALCKMMQKFDATGHLAFSQVEEGIKSRLPALKMSLLLLQKLAVSRHMVILVCQLFFVYSVCCIPWYEKSSGRFCIFIPIKSSLCINCRQGIQKFIKHLHLNSLLKWRLTSLGYGIFCGVIKPTFALTDRLTATIAEFGQVKTSTLFKNNPCILKKSQCGAVLLLNLSLEHIFLKR